jgi:hypothetical protein
VTINNLCIFDSSTMDDQNSDRETVVSEEVYFDYETPTRQQQQQQSSEFAKNDYYPNVNDEILFKSPSELEEMISPLPSPPPPIPDDIPVTNFFDLVSELSSDVYPSDFHNPTPHALTTENLVAMNGGKGTPKTVPSQHDPFEDVDVTAWNSEGLSSSKRKTALVSKRGVCFGFVCLLAVVSVVSIAVGVSQMQMQSDTTNIRDASGVVGSPETTVSPTAFSAAGNNSDTTEAPSVSPSDLSSTSFPSDNPLSDSETGRPTAIPTYFDPTNGPFPTTSEPADDDETPEPTPLPTREPTSKPTDDATPGPTDKPTARQTPAPTPQPSPRPNTPSPTNADTAGACTNQVYTSQSCYIRGSDIQVFFENCDPLLDDWIGIYSDPGELDATMLEDGANLWRTTCGGENVCTTSNPVSSGSITFDDTYFLSEGTYGVFLARDGSSPPYPSLAGYSFEISSDCS